MTHEEKQIHNAVHAELREFEEFKDLVTKMRDAQDTANRALAELNDYSAALIYINKAEALEKEVDFFLNRIGI